MSERAVILVGATPPSLTEALAREHLSTSPVAVQVPGLEGLDSASATAGGLIVVGSCSSDVVPCTAVLLRHDLWACRDHETACHDGLDDDCDGLIDAE